ncbi:MAG: serine hydrolase domain-containing protein [Planctomycetota bacterium]
MLGTQVLRSLRLLVLIATPLAGIALGVVALGAIGLAATATRAGDSRADCAAPLFMTRADIPGLGLADVRDDRIDVTVHGYARAPVDCVTDATVFEAASLTQPVVAYLVLRLVDRGQLDLDDPMIDLLPTLPLPTDDGRSARVTVRMALAHMTGLEGPDDRPLVFASEPGANFRYYPAGYRLVQRVVEHIEGATLEEIARREVFGPLGMESSSLVFRADLLDRVATRHRMLGDALERDRDPNRPANAAASLITTPADYGRFLRATLKGEGLTTTSHHAMLKPQIQVPESGGRVAWGLGWGLEPQRGTFFHYGDDGSAKCFTIGSLNNDRAIVYFANSFYGMAIAGEIAERLIPGPSPAVEWLGYAAWDDPRRLARLNTIRAFVEGDADLGMATFKRFGREYPDLDMDSLANFVSWILDGRSKHEGRARVLAWQLERQPDNLGLMLERARSLQACGDSAGAIETLRNAMQRADEPAAERLGNQIRWIEDELKMIDPSRRPSPVAARALAGQFGERRISVESGVLWYQRADRPRYKLAWMHGTTYRFEGDDSFRIRFEVERGRASKVVGLYADGRTDESLRTGAANE